VDSAVEESDEPHDVLQEVNAPSKNQKELGLCSYEPRIGGLLHRVLVSRDASWYHVGQPQGGAFRPLETVFTAFIPAARAAGFSDAEIHTLFIDNPAAAFSISVRTTRS